MTTSDATIAPAIARASARPRPGIRRKPSRVGLFRVMAHTGVRMMLHDKLKMMGTLLGVVFAVLLSSQQAGTFLGLLNKNTMFLDNAGADLWLVPKNTLTFQPGRSIQEPMSKQARGVPGVAWADPLLFGAAQITLPGGGTEAVQVVGVKAPWTHGGPWNLVAGERSALGNPDTMIFEDGDREKFGGLNIGSVREVNGRLVQVGGFTWGLVPFGPSYAFADFDLARLLLKQDSDRAHFVLVGLEPGADAATVKADLARALPDIDVMTRDEFGKATIKFILTRTAIGVTLGTSALFGLIIGFVIVALTTFSAVVDNIREFGTLKAIGATTWDLAKLLLAQSVCYALFGSLIGLAAVTRVANAIRSPNFAMVITPKLAGGVTLLMLVICILASSFALVRLRKLEPAMVFR